MSGQRTRKRSPSAAARKSKSRPLRVRPCAQTSVRELAGSPHSRYETRWKPCGLRLRTKCWRGCSIAGTSGEFGWKERREAQRIGGEKGVDLVAARHRVLESQ